MTKEKAKDILIRALKTFYQAFIPAFIIFLQNGDFSRSALLSTLLAGTSAFISALNNIVLSFMEK